jgi:hypothetical protein
MLGNLLKAVVGAVVETPIAIAADVVTLGGTRTDRQKSYTAQAVKKIVENVQEATESEEK